MSYLHSKAIVHRDVKTENMLLETNKTLKIADFGVARVEAQNPQDMTGETGTLGYMAPEVCNVYNPRERERDPPKLKRKRFGFGELLGSGRKALQQEM